MRTSTRLRQMIEAGEQFVGPGVHDPLSAKLVKQLGFNGLYLGGFSSSAPLVTMEPLMTMTEQVGLAQNITKVVGDLPLIVDGHTAYGEPVHVTRAVREFEAAGAEIWTFPAESGRVDLRRLVRAAGKRGMISLLIEGGRDLATAALADRIVDELMLYVAPRLLGAGISGVGDLGIELVDKGITLERMVMKRLGDDALISGKVLYPCSQG